MEKYILYTTIICTICVALRGLDGQMTYHVICMHQQVVLFAAAFILQQGTCMYAISFDSI